MLDNLKSLDLDGIRPIYDWQTGHEADAARKLGRNYKLVTRSEQQLMVDGRQLGDAVAHIGTLPVVGATYHLVSGGQYSLFHLLEAVMKLAAAPLEYLAICTLGFSAVNVAKLAEMMDAGRVKQLDFVFSLFFKSNEKELAERLTVELAGRGARVLSPRCHSKLLLMRFGDGHNYVAESSANLRSSANIEQTVLTNDAKLVDFHATWINSLFEEAAP